MWLARRSVNKCRGVRGVSAGNTGRVDANGQDRPADMAVIERPAIAAYLAATYGAARSCSISAPRLALMPVDLVR